MQGRTSQYLLPFKFFGICDKANKKCKLIIRQFIDTLVYVISNNKSYCSVKFVGCKYQSFALSHVGIKEVSSRSYCYIYDLLPYNICLTPVF